MENKRKNIDDLLREGLGSYTEAPPPDIWASLDKRLPSGPSRRFVFPYWGWLVILLFAGGVAGSYQWLHQPSASPAKKDHPAIALNTKQPAPNVAPNPPAPSTITPPPQVIIPAAATSAPARPLTVVPGSTGIISFSRGKRNNAILPPPVDQPPVAANAPKMPVPNALAPGNPTLPEQPLKPGIVARNETAAKPPARVEAPIEIQAPQTQKAPRSKKYLPVEAGVKAGYELGFTDQHVNKIVLGGFVGMKLGRKLSLQVSPTYQFGSISGTLFHNGSYYHINTTRVDSLTIQDTQGNKTYRYMPYQNYDSIVVTRQMKTRQLWEVTVPILMRYAVTKRLAVFAGPSVTFSNRPAVTETKNTIAGLVVSDSVTLKSQVPYSRFNELFTRSGQPIDSLAPLNDELPSPVRLGYQAGVAYEYNRFLAEVLVQQQLSGTGGMTTEQLKQIYKQPYFRLMLGYKFLTYKNRKK